jgi:putative PIN family toxin of toxin-antitoxin system
VLDTNIWISGLLLPKSKAGQILWQWKASKINIVTSQPILDEIKEVLLYPKIQKRIQWHEQKIDQFISLLQFLTDYISIDSDFSTHQVNRDPDDNIILLHTFLASKADYLITGDKDLLVLNHEYSILSLAKFYDKI